MKTTVVALYPTRTAKGRSFKGVKPVTIPDQSMGLKEIIQRFVRYQQLPVLQEGFYADIGDVDLEKLRHADIGVQQQMIAEIKEKVDGEKKRLAKEASDKEAAAKAEADKRAAREAALDALLAKANEVKT